MAASAVHEAVDGECGKECEDEQVAESGEADPDE